MIRVFRLASVLLAATAGSAYAQSPAPAAPEAVDSAAQNVVTTFSIRSGRLQLSSAAHPKPVRLPDGTYTDDINTVIVIVDGAISRIQSSSGTITDISSTRLSRQRVVMLMPSTNALMAVTEITLPSGLFKSDDGKSSLTIMAGRPVAFTIPSGS